MQPRATQKRRGLAIRSPGIFLLIWLRDGTEWRPRSRISNRDTALCHDARRREAGLSSFKLRSNGGDPTDEGHPSRVLESALASQVINATLVVLIDRADDDSDHTKK